MTTLLLFGDSKAAAAGLKHRAPIRLPRKDPKDTFTESQGDVPPVCAKDILGRNHQILTCVLTGPAQVCRNAKLPGHCPHLPMVERFELYPGSPKSQFDSQTPRIEASPYELSS